MTLLATIKGPYVDWASLSPMAALAIGALIVLCAGLFRSNLVRETLVPTLAAVTLLVSIALEIARFHHQRGSVVSGALAIDDLAFILDMVFSVSALAAVVLSWRGHAAREAGQGEYYSLLLFSVLGMAILVSAQNLVTLFLGIELLSIPLYVLCAAESRREGSLESGLKYLVIGSVGSATLVYGLAMIYGATGSMNFAGIAAAVNDNGVLGDSLLFGGLALVTVGFAFKASVAPFHQWTPDVYEGAPTPVTAFMATATKAAAIGVLLRFFDVAVSGAQDQWGPLLATLAVITIIAGNVGALGQSSLKRMLAYSGVAQAGYMLGGLVVGTQLGIKASVFYLCVYLAMNVAAFAVIVAREREHADPFDAPEGRSDQPGDDLAGLAGLGARRPGLALPMTIAMLSLSGIPGTVGFIGKFTLIRALVDGNYTWLAIVLVIGSMLSLGYYLRVVATIWMSPAPSADALPAIAGADPVADLAAEPAPHGEVVAIAVLFGAAAVFFGVFPGPLLHLAQHAGTAISGIF
jgi:NADH-quinone oxidoreductase subunit N